MTDPRIKDIDFDQLTERLIQFAVAMPWTSPMRILGSVLQSSMDLSELNRDLQREIRKEVHRRLWERRHSLPFHIHPPDEQNAIAEDGSGSRNE